MKKKISVQCEICLVSNLWLFCLWANFMQSLYIVNILILYFQFPVLPRVTSYDSHPRRHSHEDQGFRCPIHMKDYRKCSEDGPFKDPLESQRRSHSKTRAFSESFEQQLCFRTKHSMSLVCNRVIEYLNHFRKGNPKGSFSLYLWRTNVTFSFIASWCNLWKMTLNFTVHSPDVHSF